MVIYPMDKKSFVEVQEFQYMDTTIQRRIVWRYGELVVDPVTGVLELGYCNDFSHVEFEHDQDEIIDMTCNESEVIDKLNNHGYKLIDTWYEINGRFDIRL